MSRPSTRQELADYCLRALGAPVVEINVDDDQVDDRIDEALQYYQEYHGDAVVRTFIKHVITQDEYDSGIITCPDEIISVLRIFNIASGETADMFNVKYQMFLNDMYGLRNPGDLVNYEITKQYLGLLENVLSGSCQQIIYSRHQNTLRIKSDWQNYLSVGQYIIIECYTAINPQMYPDVYNDMALKRYTTALIKRQWGLNILKFEGMQLPGGVTLNGRAIYDDATAEIQRMEEEFSGRFGTPPDFFIG